LNTKTLTELSTEQTVNEQDFSVEIDDVFGGFEDAISECPWTCSWTCAWTSWTK
jgi:hypothetical protein